VQGDAGHPGLQGGGQEKNKLGGETPSWIRAWSLIHNKKIVLDEKTAMCL
jgi:hypothetical protein